MNRLIQKKSGLTAIFFSISLTIALFPYDAAIGTEKDDGKNKSQNSSRQLKSSPTKMVYQPPLRGAPASRVGAGARGEDTDTRLYVLTPDHTGLTQQQQPILYWYVSKPIDVNLEFAIIKDSNLKTIFEKKYKIKKDAGIQKVSLADHAVKLQPNTEYQWFVTIIGDKDQRSKDTVASGMIKYIEPASNPNASISDTNKAIELARKGFWYDALSTLSEQITQQPDDLNLRDLRAQLLEQAGLQEIAELDRKTANLN